MTPTGPKQEARPPNCEYEMFTTLPEGHVEVATIDHTPSTAFDVYKDLAAFKDAVRAKVCQAGGDAAIAFANGKGWYIKATVLKRKAGVESTPAAGPGCQFDTQCKGDRVCVKGECVEPPSASPAPAAAAPAAESPPAPAAEPK